MTGMILSVASGVLTALAFPKSDLGFLAWLGLVPFFIALFNAKRYNTAALYGLVFGSVYFFGVFLWVFSLSRWVGPWAYIGLIFLSLYQSLFIVLFSLAVLYSIKNFDKRISVLLVPLLWVFFEYLRCIGPFASAGALMGYTQHNNLPMIQIARWVKVYGVSFVVVMVNIVIASFIITKGKFKDNCVNVAFAGVVVCISLIYGTFELSRADRPVAGKAVKISVIQPSFDQAFKMNPANSFLMLDLMCKMSVPDRSESTDIIIWPETAVMNFPERVPGVMSRLSGTARAAGAYLITGAFSYEKGDLYNSVFCISPDGKITSRYDKEHLMPFGEYLPFRALLYPMLKGTGYFDQDQSPNHSPVSLQSGGCRIGTMICFESLFSGIAAERAKDADFLLTLTNDAWFGKSSAAQQHIIAGSFRAIENRKYFIQAANNRISAVIDPWGRVVARTSLWDRTKMDFVIYPDNASR